jgi:hypothetical protein
MLNPDWKPSDVRDLQEEVKKFRVKIKPNLPLDEILRLQLEVLMFASSLTQTVNEARWYETKCSSEKSRAYTDAFLLAEGSDRKRDAEAKRDQKVRIAEVKSAEAEVYRKLLEDTKEDYLKLHYALRAQLKDATEEKKFGM